MDISKRHIEIFIFLWKCELAKNLTQINHESPSVYLGNDLARDRLQAITTTSTKIPVTDPGPNQTF